MNKCIDAGRRGCPCALAESGHCLVCSKLNGGNCDDCGWQGTCIYSIYHQNRQCLAEDRTPMSMEILGIRTYGPRCSVFILQAGLGFCQQAAKPGAYVFARAEEADRWYDMPVSILKSQPGKGLIHLGVCGCGPKSESLLSATKAISVRGVYENGLSGLDGLHQSPDKTIVFAKGIAIAPLRNFLDGGQRYAKYLKNLRLYVDLEKVGFDFFRDYFGDIPAASITIKDFAKEGLPLLTMDDTTIAAQKVNIFALTSPFYAEQIGQQIQQTASASGTQTAIIRPNEGNFCCGEGVCGACTCTDPKGNTIRRCKFVQ